MITELTPEQIEMQKEHVEYWINRARNTDNLEENEVTEAVGAMYEILKRKTPSIEMGRSPIECWRKVCDISKIGKKEYKNIILPGVDGYFESGFFAFYDFFEMIGVKLPESYHTYRKTAVLNFFWCLDEVCVVCDRPNIIEFGSQGLHSEAGPSVEWQDGTQCWMIDGIKVDEQIVMQPETQTLKQMQSETNEDVKSLRIDRYGWLRYLNDIKAEVLSERSNNLEGTYEVLYKTDQNRRIFVCTCMTGKIPALSVPDMINTCEEAQIWLKGDTEIDIVART